MRTESAEPRYKMPVSTESFFENYAQAFQSRIPEALAELYFIPLVIMSDDIKNVFTDLKDIIHHIQGLMNELDQVGVVKIAPDVCQTLRLSDSIVFSNVKWLFYDLKGDQIFSCFISYTLQCIENELRVIVSVIDDEKRKVSKLL